MIGRGPRREKTVRRELSAKEVERIRQVIIGHVKWLRKIDGGVNGNLSHMDLSGWALAGVDLRQMNFMGSSLVKANLSNTKLGRANFFMADLEGANLSGADLSQADMRGCILKDCNLTGTILEGADLGRGNVVAPRFQSTGNKGLGQIGTHATDLSKAVLINANLQGCDMTGALMRGCDLSGANLSHAVLNEATMVDVRVDGANFSGAVTLGAEMDPEIKRMVDSTNRFEFHSDAIDMPMLLAAHRRFLETDGGDGARLDLSDKQVGDFDFAGAVLPAVRLRDCNLKYANFSGCNLSFADFSGSDLTGAIFIGADLSAASFKSATLDDSVFKAASVRRIQLANDGSQMMPTNFANASLINADFTGADLDGPMFHGAAMSKYTLESLHRATTNEVDLKRVVLVRREGE